MIYKPCYKDMPKVQDAPAPQYPCILTVYIHPDGGLIGRFHAEHSFDVVYFEGRIHDPEAFANVVDSYRALKK